MGLPSNNKLLREAGSPGQEPVGFGTPRKGRAGPFAQIAAPEVMPGPGMCWGTSHLAAHCLWQSSCLKSCGKQQSQQSLRYRNAFISPLGWK